MGAPYEYGVVIVWWDSSSVWIWCMSGWLGVLGGRLDCEDVCLRALPLYQWARAWRSSGILEHPLWNIPNIPEHRDLSQTNTATNIRHGPRAAPAWSGINLSTNHRGQISVDK